MGVASKIILALIAVLHLYILWLEMFAWTTAGRRVFRTIPKDLFERTKVMAANQGLYNGFLAAGLIWALIIPDPDWARNVGTFFLTCVLVAGLYGGYSVHQSVFMKQGLPALVGIVLLWMGW
jgi:putative membrane protein